MGSAEYATGRRFLNLGRRRPDVPVQLRQPHRNTPHVHDRESDAAGDRFPGRAERAQTDAHSGAVPRRGIPAGDRSRWSYTGHFESRVDGSLCRRSRRQRLPIDAENGRPVARGLPTHTESTASAQPSGQSRLCRTGCHARSDRRFAGKPHRFSPRRSWRGARDHHAERPRCRSQRASGRRTHRRHAAGVDDTVPGCPAVRCDRLRHPRPLHRCEFRHQSGHYAGDGRLRLLELPDR